MICCLRSLPVIYLCVSCKWTLNVVLNKDDRTAAAEWNARHRFQESEWSVKSYAIHSTQCDVVDKSFNWSDVVAVDPRSVAPAWQHQPWSTMGDHGRSLLLPRPQWGGALTTLAYLAYILFLFLTLRSSLQHLFGSAVTVCSHCITTPLYIYNHLLWPICHFFSHGPWLGCINIGFLCFLESPGFFLIFQAPKISRKISLVLEIRA